MIFTGTKIKGVYIIEPEFLTDERGFFTRSFCKEEFRNYGIDTDIVQCNISYNKKKGTLRGMHFQVPPFEEVKIVSCTKGSIYDVVVDLRRYSSTYLQWHSEKLSADSYRMLYIPKGCAHGFQTLEDNCIVYYQMGEYYHSECSVGIRWNDPSIGIVWPLPTLIISEKDKNYGDLKG
jgi:dTDP-4-dehydrorhamnose 3,5-epimerase